MSDGMTRTEALAAHAVQDQRRAYVEVFNEGTEDEPEYVAEWEGVTVRAQNPFGLDSRMGNAGFPVPRNLYLISEEDR